MVFGDEAGVGQGTENFAQGTENDRQGSELACGPYDGRGRTVDGLQNPLIDSLDDLNPQFLEDLKAIAGRTGGRSKVPIEITRTVILAEASLSDHDDGVTACPSRRPMSPI
ncbi:hypothetical protein [Magnetospirillum sp. 15-1]|uniref:hypothetical protein n=1 Tax=Magnetospirillum sp. 15-1 TaxID=1979370 RepID=UPI000BBBF45D|nr:hypothetical protein [Magnetospirillum sp. 15-1]